MGFKALLDREDFFEILRKTLIQYFREKGVDDICISYESVEGAREFIFVPEFGMVMPPFPSRDIQRHYYCAYNIRNNRLKNILAKCGIFVATHSKNVLSLKQHLYIYPKDTVNDNTIISVCNRSIRIFDLENKSTASIQKQGFTDKYFLNQLCFRLEHDYDFIPKFLNHGKFWFEETLLDGNMLARETNNNRYDSSKKSALEHMKTVADDTLEYFDAGTYCKDLIERISSLFDRAKKQKNISTTKEAEKLFSGLLPRLEDISGEIPTAITHGDLQAGNIWIDQSEKVWIIDWETQERRSCWFDIVTLEYSTRYDGGIQSLINSISDITKINLCCWASCELALEEMILIYIAEDIIFNIEDMLELPDNGGSSSFDRYIKELNQIDWHQLY